MHASGKTRIVYVSGASYMGGAEKYIYLLAGGLDIERFEPVLVTTGVPGIEPLCSALRSKGVRTEDTGGMQFDSIAGIIRFNNIIRRLRPEILHMNMPGPFDCNYGIPAAISGMAGIRRIITTEHLPMVESFTRARILRSLYLSSISRVITVSEDNKMHLIRNHAVKEGNIRVVLNGIPNPGPAASVSTFNAAEAPGQLRLLIAGSLEERKGHLIMLAAMERLPAEILLYVAGEGPMRKRLEEAASSEKLVGRVIILGKVDDVPDLIAGCDVLVVPSLLEATPYVIFEAMAAAKPVVASAIFGIPEQVDHGETGILTKSGDSDSLAEAILRLHADIALRRKMGEAGRSRFKSRFRIERSIKETVNVYEEVL